jgi:hypothetical protein
MGLYTVDDHQILAHFQDCSTPFGPIPPVGELCRLPQLHNLVIEPLNPRQENAKGSQAFILTD